MHLKNTSGVQVGCTTRTCKGQINKHVIAMIAKERLAISVIIMLVVASGVFTFYNTNTNAGNKLQVQLFIYKNNKLVYYDEDDPATKQFLLLIGEIIAGDLISGFTDTNGAKHVYIDGSNQPAYVFVTDQPQAYVFTMNALPSNHVDGKITQYYVDYEEKSISFAGSIIINQNTTIRGVGIYSLMKVDGQQTPQQFLLFYDPLQQQINVTAGDVITVVYKISVP